MEGHLRNLREILNTSRIDAALKHQSERAGEFGRTGEMRQVSPAEIFFTVPELRPALRTLPHAKNPAQFL
jgi:hypothetical protein